MATAKWGIQEALKQLLKAQSREILQFQNKIANFEATNFISIKAGNKTRFLYLLQATFAVIIFPTP